MDASRLAPSVIAELAAVVGPDFVLTGDEDRMCYGYDGQMVECLPDAVVRPADAEQIARLLRLANDAGFVVVPRGGGTGLSGGSIASQGGIVLDLTRMDRILEIDEGNLHAVVEPGVITSALTTAAEKRGLLYPPDPGSMKVSTLGGNVAENAGGLRAIKYGVTRNYLMQVEAISPTGVAFRSGAKTRKCVAGYDLVSLLCGSEGTLGVITQITMRLVAMPRHRRSMTATFECAAAAGQAVSNIIAHGLLPATLEIMDNFTLRTIEDYAHLGLPIDAGALVLVEFDGFAEDAVAEEADAGERVLRESSAVAVKSAADGEERENLWAARRSALAALTRARPTSILEDVTVPLPQLAPMIERVETIASDNRLSIGTFGHAGDGNLHPTLLADERDSEEMARVEAAIGQIIDAALELGGTVSGEHGIGFAKAPYLEQEIGAGSLRVMESIKCALDPNDILNPGKFTRREVPV